MLRGSMLGNGERAVHRQCRGCTGAAVGQGMGCPRAVQGQDKGRRREQRERYEESTRAVQLLAECAELQDEPWRRAPIANNCRHSHA